MSLRSGVPPQFRRGKSFGSETAAKFAADKVRLHGNLARVIPDPENGKWIIFIGPKRRRRHQKRWEV